jgi:hypothetical protein
MIPIMLHSPDNNANSGSLGFVPGQGSDAVDRGLIDVWTVENNVRLMYMFFSIAMAGFELLFRKQYWTEFAGGATNADSLVYHC